MKIQVDVHVTVVFFIQNTGTWKTMSHWYVETLQVQGTVVLLMFYLLHFQLCSYLGELLPQSGLFLLLIPCSLFAVHRSSFRVPRSLFPVPRSPFPVPRSLSFVLCPSFSVPSSYSLFLVPCFLFLVSYSLFLVPCSLFPDPCSISPLSPLFHLFPSNTLHLMQILSCKLHVHKERWTKSWPWIHQLRQHCLGASRVLPAPYHGFLGKYIQ